MKAVKIAIAAAVILCFGAVAAHADDWRDHEEHAREWRKHHHHDHDHPVIIEQQPDIVFAPPVVVEPPVQDDNGGNALNLIFPINIH